MHPLEFIFKHSFEKDFLPVKTTLSTDPDFMLYIFHDVWWDDINIVIYFFSSFSKGETTKQLYISLSAKTKVINRNYCHSKLVLFLFVCQKRQISIYFPKCWITALCVLLTQLLCYILKYSQHRVNLSYLCGLLREDGEW